MKKFVYFDRWGYPRIIEASSRDEALQVAENLSPEGLRFAHGSIGGILGVDYTEDEVYRLDRERAISLGASF